MVSDRRVPGAAGERLARWPVAAAALGNRWLGSRWLGPVRRSPRTAGLLVALLLGLVMIGIGASRAAQGPQAVTLTVRVGADHASPALVIGPGVLQRGGSGLTVHAVGATADSPVFLGLARTPDAQAELGAVARATVDARQLDAVSPDAVSPDAAGADSGSVRLPVPVSPGEAQLPDPATSDVWAATATGRGSAQLTAPQDGSGWTVVAASDGSAAAPAVELPWATTRAAPASAPWLIPGVLLAALALVPLLLTFLSRRRPRPPGSTEPSASALSAPEKGAE